MGQLLRSFPSFSIQIKVEGDSEISLPGFVLGLDDSISLGRRAGAQDGGARG